jgi:APA family basic amino acid/polyamine antiporter
MPETIQEIFKRKIVPVRFQASMSLLGATTLGVGALMGAGIYVLIGLAAGHAGPSAWLSYLLCGLLSFISVLMYGELARRVPVTGGGYAYAHHGLGSFAAFMTGWLLALGSIFACAMYALGFAFYITSILAQDLPGFMIKGIALLIVVLLTIINCFGTKGSDRILRFFTWGNLLVLLILILFSLPQAKTEMLKPLFPRGLTGMVEAIPIIYVSFFGYQLIANNAEEIRDATKTVPKAMILSMMVSLIFYVAIALISVMVVPWQVLSGSSAPLVEVALKGIGRLGWFLVAVGGILAAGAALNSTLLSQSRQIFAMGKDGFLPPLLGRIHHIHRTPVAALWLGGLTTIIAVAVGNLSFIVKSANFCLIVSSLPVSLALAKLYKTSAPEKRPSFLKRCIPWAALIANLSLLLTFDTISIFVGLQLTGIGVLIFFFYSRKPAARSRAGTSIVLTDRKKPILKKGYRILIPLANPKTQQALFSLSEALLEGRSGELMPLTVIEAYDQIDLSGALDEIDKPLQILDESAHSATTPHTRIRPILRVSRSLSRGIVDAAEEEGCSLIVMGYAGDDTGRSFQIMEEVLNLARTDTLLLKLKDAFSPRRIGVALGSSLNLPLMVRVAGALADRFSGEITFLNILPTQYTPEQKTHADKVLVEAIRKHGSRALYRSQVASADDPLTFLVEKSKDFDFLIVGTTKVGFLQRATVGTFSSQLVGSSHCSVAVVRVVPPVKKLIPSQGMSNKKTP